MSIKLKEDLPFSSVSSRRLSGSRRLSSEMPVPVHLSSIEVYYAGAPVAVPFKWESQPGTPRVRFRETPLPPLTPPPSFLFNTHKTPNRKNSKPKGGLLHAVMPRLISTRKNQNHNSPISPTSSSSSLFSLSSYSDSASSRYTPNNHRQPRRRSSEDQDGYASSPVSTLCFRIRRTATPNPTRPRSTESKNC